MCGNFLSDPRDLWIASIWVAYHIPWLQVITIKAVYGAINAKTLYRKIKTAIPSASKIFVLFNDVKIFSGVIKMCQQCNTHLWHCLASRRLRQKTLIPTFIFKPKLIKSKPRLKITCCVFSFTPLLASQNSLLNFFSIGTSVKYLFFMPNWGNSYITLKGTATLMITIFNMKDLNQPWILIPV